VETVSTKQQRIAILAQQTRGKALTSLHHHIDGAWLLEAWRRTRQDGASGVDGQSAQQYAENLHGNLADLLERFKSGRYKAPPVRRVNICQPLFEVASLAVSLRSARKAMAKAHGPSAYRPSKTRYCNEPSPCC
jgi:hypothetical protein